MEDNQITDNDKEDDKQDRIELVQRAVEGDKEAFTNLYTLTYSEVYHIVKVFIHNEDTAQDIVQEVQVYIAPKIIGGAEAKTPVEGKGVPDPNGAYRFAFDRMEQVGDDILLRYRKEKREICLQES